MDLPLEAIDCETAVGVAMFWVGLWTRDKFCGTIQYHDFALSFDVNSMLPLFGFEVLGFTSPNSVYGGECLHGVCPIHQ